MTSPAHYRLPRSSGTVAGLVVLFCLSGCGSGGFKSVLPWNWFGGNKSSGGGGKAPAGGTDGWMDTLLHSGEAAASTLIGIGGLSLVAGIALFIVSIWTRMEGKAGFTLMGVGIALILTGSIVNAVAPIVVIAAAVATAGALVMSGIWVYRKYLKKKNGNAIHPKLETQ